MVLMLMVQGSHFEKYSLKYIPSSSNLNPLLRWAYEGELTYLTENTKAYSKEIVKDVEERFTKILITAKKKKTISMSNKREILNYYIYIMQFFKNYFFKNIYWYWQMKITISIQVKNTWYKNQFCKTGMWI